MVELDGKLHVLGGSTPSWLPMNAVEIYDPTNDKWTSGKPLREPRRLFDAAAFKFDRIKDIIIQEWETCISPKLSFLLNQSNNSVLIEDSIFLAQTRLFRLSFVPSFVADFCFKFCYWFFSDEGFMRSFFCENNLRSQMKIGESFYILVNLSLVAFLSIKFVEIWFFKFYNQALPFKKQIVVNYGKRRENENIYSNQNSTKQNSCKRSCAKACLFVLPPIRTYKPQTNHKASCLYESNDPWISDFLWVSPLVEWYWDDSVLIPSSENYLVERTSK